MLKVGIITQARMTSTRLPGKVLLRTGGSSLLEHHIRRLSWSGIPVFVATTVNSTDQPIVDMAASTGMPCFRGSEDNVLERYYLCARQANLDVIVRVTSDCPLVDGFLIADGVRQYLSFNSKQVYYSNVIKRTFPRGLDFEIFSMDLLSDAYENAIEQSDKVHVTPYINQNKSGNVKMKHHTSDEDHSNLRWTVDTPDDWRLVTELFDVYQVAEMRYNQVLGVVLGHEELQHINYHIKQKGT